jgi:hypothetical protein
VDDAILVCPRPCSHVVDTPRSSPSPLCPDPDHETWKKVALTTSTRHHYSLLFLPSSGQASAPPTSPRHPQTPPMLPRPSRPLQLRRRPRPRPHWPPPCPASPAYKRTPASILRLTPLLSTSQTISPPLSFPVSSSPEPAVLPVHRPFPTF